MTGPEYEYTTEKVSISLHSSLVELLRDHCERHGYSKSGFIRKAVENQLLSEVNKKPILEQLYRNFMR